MLRSIGLIERSLGHSHLDLIRPALNLARVYEELKQWNLAKASVERARVIAEMQLPPQHNIMAEILWTCASIAKKTGHRREAQDLSRRARAIAAAQPKDSGAWVHAADLVRPVRDDFPRRLLGLDRPASSVAR